MWDRLLALLQGLEFWLFVAGGILLWWAIGFAIARLAYAFTDKPLTAVRKAAVWATILAPAAMATMGWSQWADAAKVTTLAVVMLIVTLFIYVLLGRFEPRLEAE